MADFREMYLEEFENEMKKTRRMLQAVPDEDPEYTPHPKSMTLARLAGHVSHLAGWPAMILNEDVSEMTANSPTFPSLQKHGRQLLLEQFENYVSDSRAALEKTDEAHLDKHWKFIYMGRTVLDMPRKVVLTDVCMNHLIHHRGQLSVYVRMLGGKVPGVYGPSADDKESM